MVLYKFVLTIVTVSLCRDLADGFIFASSSTNISPPDDGLTSLSQKESYLIELLRRLEDIAQSHLRRRQFHSASPNNFRRLPVKSRESKPNYLPYRGRTVEKKDFAILPPSNEWCRLMGFRRCRQSRS